MLIRALGDEEIAHIRRLSSAIAIGHLQTTFGQQFHVAILYRMGDQVRVLDLMWQRMLRSDAPSRNLGWAHLELETEQREILAGKCRDIWRKYGLPGESPGVRDDAPIPYGIEFNTTFLDDYTLSNIGPGSGFTCATFVMAILETVGKPLLKIETWKMRDDDEAWQDWVIEELSKCVPKSATLEEVKGLANTRGCYRFRASDVVAAGMAVDTPLCFQRSDEIRLRVERDVAINFAPLGAQSH